MLTLECAMINKFGTDINSIDESDIKNPIEIPVEAKPRQFLGKGLELEKSVSKTQAHLSSKMWKRLKMQ